MPESYERMPDIYESVDLPNLVVKAQPGNETWLNVGHAY